MTGTGVASVRENGFALRWDEIQLPRPVFAGDALYPESAVLEVRPSRSRPTQDIVKVGNRDDNQVGDLVIHCRRSVMVWKRDSASSAELFPAAPSGQ